ncbi:MAG: DUF3784 domain-containing protein [Syntrophaceticus sp.]|nr:DUF3784 domain-containing protein [Syntrophaceticus sp.]
MEELIITAVISGIIFFLGVLIKHFKAYDLIAGYNTASKEEKEYMASKGLGDFVGRQIMLSAAVPLIGPFLKWAGFIWGIEISIAIFLIVIFYIVIGARRFTPPPSFYSSKSMKGKTTASKANITVLVISAVVVIAVVGGIIWTAKPNEFALEQNELRIIGVYGTDIGYSDIESLELSEAIPQLKVRSNGLGLGPIQKGHFKTEDMGDALLFMQSKSGPVIIIQREGQEMVMINFADSEKTRMLYQQLKSNVDS